jgi:glycosyltransferase involved in cell wall biosynthesis
MAVVTSLQEHRARDRPQRPLKVLLSAYACEPNRGSEPGIGWQWATRLAKLGHEIHVVTRENNRESIVAACGAHPIPTLHFIYFDLPKWASFWKKGGRGVHLYYFLWQCFSYPIVRDLHRRVGFDVVHHLTFGVFRQPSLLGLLGAPFVFGPVGGGERAPRKLRSTLPPVARVKEWLRDAANVYARIDPFLRFVFRRSSRILCKTEETLGCIPRFYRKQCEVFLEVGADVPAVAAPSYSRISRVSSLRVLYVGRLVHMKGLHLALPAFKQLLNEYPESRFTLVGSGAQELELRAIADELGIQSNIEWRGWLPREQLHDVYSTHDVFLFPSLHDSSGNAVLEAMTRGLPVVCLNRGGPAALIDSFSGITIDAVQPQEAIQQLGEALTLLARRPELRVFLSHGALARASNAFSWGNQVKRMNELYYKLQLHQDRRASR